MSFRREVAPGVDLRQFEMRDAEELFERVDADRAYLREWLPWVDSTASPADIRRFIQRTKDQFLANQGPQAAIRVNGRIVGTIGCHPIDWANRLCSIGYWLQSTEQGQGLMTRCCTALIDYLFEDLGLNRVVIQCGAGNMKSCAIPRRLGFTCEGVLRQAEWVNDHWVDLIVWGLLRDEWSSRTHSAAG
jgi:ribosomal-protein-serine acetyltransferase